MNARILAACCRPDAAAGEILDARGQKRRRRQLLPRGGWRWRFRRLLPSWRRITLIGELHHVVVEGSQLFVKL
jgi:hypothetical protein